MKILVFGASGFVGRAVVEELSGAGQDVYSSSRSKMLNTHTLVSDLNDVQSIVSALTETVPEVIINAAGIVDNTEASSSNLEYTKNILQALNEVRPVATPKIIICGSAAEYGYVDKKSFPVKEDESTEPFSLYGTSKKNESVYAIEYGQRNNIDVVVARIFNPIGQGMASKFMIPRLLEQIKNLDDNSDKKIEISRKDSIRDYVDVRDLAVAIRILCENATRHNIYNIGSGVATTNEQLVRSLLEATNFENKVDIVETATEAERTVAGQADINRLWQEFGWRPAFSLNDTIKEILYEEE